MHVVESDLRARAAIARGKLPRAIVERAAFDFVLSFLGFIAAIVVIRGTDAALAELWRVLAQAGLGAALLVAGLAIAGSYRSLRSQLGESAAAHVAAGVAGASIVLVLAAALHTPTGLAFGDTLFAGSLCMS